MFDCFLLAKKQVKEIENNLLHGDYLKDKFILHLNDAEWIDKVVYKNNLIEVVNDLRKQIVNSFSIDFLMEHREELGIIWERWCPVNIQPEITGYYEDEEGGLYYGTYALSMGGDFVAYADGIILR